jgi:hypothetical protein
VLVAPKGQVVELTVTTLLQNICQNVGLHENYLFLTSVVFFGWIRILEKKYSVKNSLFVDFFFVCGKGKQYCIDFCQASP